MKEGDLMEWKSLQNTQQSFLVCLQARAKEVVHEQISNKTEIFEKLLPYPICRRVPAKR